MTTITLIRHGQANSMATDEAGYDRLSDLGRQQARWLGEHMRDTGQRYAKVYTGTLTRHQQSAEEWGAEAFTADARLDEVRYFDLSERMHAQFGIPHPRSHGDFVDHLPLTFAAWQEGKIEGAPESFHDFQTRTSHVRRGHRHGDAGGDGAGHRPFHTRDSADHEQLNPSPAPDACGPDADPVQRRPAS